MKLLVTLCFTFFFFFNGLIAQSDIEWITTEGTILKIEKFRARRKIVEKATIQYTIHGDSVIISALHLDRYPIIGSLKSEGEVIEIKYNAKIPPMIQTPSKAFMTSYGLYIAIFFGICIMIYYYGKAFRSRNEKTTKLNQ